MKNKEIEIPFGAKDSELVEATYFIPDGMEAIIEGDKVIIRKKESEDERIRKFIFSIIQNKSAHSECFDGDIKKEDCIAWLEKQGKNKPTECEDKVYPHSVDHDPVADAYSRGRNNGIQLVLDNPEEYDLQKSTEWNKEDTDFKTESVKYLCNLRDTFEESKWDTKLIQRCINWLLEFPKPQSYWKPSKEQMKALYDSIPEKVMEISEREVLLNELYKDLLKL